LYDWAVEPLEPPDLHYVSSAIGWLGLGSINEAKSELDRISAAVRNHPDVLEVRWVICVEEKRWDDGLQIARSLMHWAPDRSSGWLHQAYALRRVPDGGVKQAWHALLPAFDKFPKDSIISYNLSCYACQMQQLEAARVWFKRALVIGGKDKIKRMALEDPDLQPLWDEIKEL
jgi:predicted Zn-dependent protease